MEQVKIDRINELAKASRERKLTDTEKAEQDALRKEYIAAIRSNFRETLDNICFTEGNDTKC